MGVRLTDEEGKRAVSVVLALASVCCAHRHEVLAPDPAGKTSVRVLNAPEIGGGSGLPAALAERITPAYASADNKLPEYPLYAIKAGCGQGVVAPAFRQTPIVDPAADARAPVLHWKQEPVAIYLDVEFSFEIVAGKGVVRTR